MPSFTVFTFALVTLTLTLPSPTLSHPPSTLLFPSSLALTDTTSNSSSSYDFSEEGMHCEKSCRDGLVCLNNTCQNCESDHQCEADGHSQSRCTKTQFLKHTQFLCAHKPLFGASISADDFLSFFIFFVAAALSAGGGVGGGGIFVPILILVNQFSTKDAVPLSNIIVSGASVANFLQNFPKRHPNSSSRPLIDYVVALLIEPQTLGGTVVGVYLHHIFPSWLVLLLLIVAMSLTTIRTSLKGVSMYKKENEKAEKSISSLLGDDDYKEVREMSSLLGDEEKKEEKMVIPWTKIVALVVILVVSTALSILKGGGSDKSVVGVEACTPVYWLTAAAIFPVIFLVWGFEGYSSIKTTKHKLNNGIPFVFGDVKWNTKRVFAVGSVSFFAGILASLLGVGGGLVKGPVLIEIGLPPEVVAATSSYMILFTSISASIQYILIGKIMWDYGIVLFLIGFVASLFGQTILNKVVAKSGRKSFIIFVIAFVIAISAILLVVSEVVQFLTAGGNNGFILTCPDSGGE